MVSAIYLLVQNDATTANAMTMAAKNEVLKHVKRVGRRMLQAGVVEIPTLPTSPSEFRNKYLAKYEEVFGSASPVAHPFGIGLEMFAQSIKMRICDSHVGSAALPLSSSGSSSSNSLQQNMCSQLATMMMKQLMEQMAGPQLLPLQMLGGGQPHAPARALPAPTPSAVPSASSCPLEGPAEDIPKAQKSEGGKKQPRLSVQDAAERVRSIMDKAKHDGGDDADRHSKKPKVMKRPAKEAASTSDSKAIVAMEKKRSQMRCRRSDGSSFAIPWGHRNGVWIKSQADAVAEAKAWLEKQRSGAPEE